MKKLSVVICLLIATTQTKTKHDNLRAFEIIKSNCKPAIALATAAATQITCSTITEILYQSGWKKRSCQMVPLAAVTAGSVLAGCGTRDGNTSTLVVGVGIALGAALSAYIFALETNDVKKKKS